MSAESAQVLTRQPPFSRVAARIRNPPRTIARLCLEAQKQRGSAKL
jgi:hypothetical protein